jgi:hypothetical protein
LSALELAAIAGAAIAIWVLYLYRKKRLREDHAILWLFVSLSIVLISTWTDLLTFIRTIVGAREPTDLVVAIFIAFLLITCIYYSVKISELTEQNRKISQELAIIRGTPEQKKPKQTVNNGSAA